MAITYHPIGVVESPTTEPLRPEAMRGVESRLVLEHRFAPAVTALEVDQHLLVIYHLHRTEAWQGNHTAELFTRRIAGRPNPIGITLVRVVATCDATITVVGLDAIHGSPILDIKPYRPVYDAPPVHPAERGEKGRAVIVLTGGPGGGKSTLIEELRRDPGWAGRFVVLPEAVQFARFANVSPDERIFQRVLVHLQMALEDGLDRALGSGDPRAILCHRGSLDPLAFWLQRGWQEDDFFDFCGIRREDHYCRYTAVIHLVTAAEGVPGAYTHWPVAHRPEGAEEAIRLDHWLERAWSGHPNYFRLDNEERDWRKKSAAAGRILAGLVLSR